MKKDPVRDANRRSEDPPSDTLTLRQGSSPVAGIEGVDVLVTGAGRGLGRGIAMALAAAGARVWLVSEMIEELEWTAEGIREAGGCVEVCPADLSRDRERERLARRVRDRADQLRVVVNNAGVLERQRVESLDREHWERIMRVNLEAPVFLTRDLLPTLLREGGSVVNVSSRAGVEGSPGGTAYCASKFGIEAFTRCLALELAGSAVSVNAVTPGIYLKPTSVTRCEAEAVAVDRKARWEDPAQLGPAFVYLAGLRGEVSGCRFDLKVLTEALAMWGPGEVVSRVGEVAEYVQEALP